MAKKAKKVGAFQILKWSILFQVLLLIGFGIIGRELLRKAKVAGYALAKEAKRAFEEDMHTLYDWTGTQPIFRLPNGKGNKGVEVLQVAYTLKKAQALLKFATVECNLPGVAELLSRGGLKFKYPPNQVAFLVPRIISTKASWYGGDAGHGNDGFHGKKMANGRKFDSNNPHLAAHQFLPLGTLLRVNNEAAGKSIEVEVADRGTCLEERGLDLSRAAAKKLGILKEGVVTVTAEIRSLGRG